MILMTREEWGDLSPGVRHDIARIVVKDIASDIMLLIAKAERDIEAVTGISYDQLCADMARTGLAVTYQGRQIPLDEFYITKPSEDASCP